MAGKRMLICFGVSFERFFCCVVFFFS